MRLSLSFGPLGLQIVPQRDQLKLMHSFCHFLRLSFNISSVSFDLIVRS